VELSSKYSQFYSTEINYWENILTCKRHSSGQGLISGKRQNLAVVFSGFLAGLKIG
jgi:hypothetical protein